MQIPDSKVTQWQANTHVHQPFKETNENKKINKSGGPYVLHQHILKLTSEMIVH